MSSTIELRVNVTEAVGASAGPLETALTVRLPDFDTLCDPPVVCFAFPGGGYNRHYYSLDLVGGGTGQADWHADRGWIFVTCDHLQVGDSSVLDPDPTTYEMIAACNKLAVDTVLARLAAGDIDAAFPPIVDPVVLGLGQSMGGCFTIVAQAHYALFDGIGVLGYSGIQTVVPSPPGIPDVVMPHTLRSGFPAAPKTLNMDDVVEAATSASDAVSLAEATGEKGEHLWTWAFHHEDESREIVQEDMAAMAGGPIPAWRSATTPACAALMVTPGTVATEAASIRVPVLIAVGERDVVPDPWHEPKAYPRSNDITVFVCPRMGHMHNFAPTRESFWARIHRFGESVVEQKLLRRGRREK